MKYAVIAGVMLYFAVAGFVFAMHTQMPVTFWLAVARSVLWPVWLLGGLRGAPLPMD